LSPEGHLKVEKPLVLRMGPSGEPQSSERQNTAQGAAHREHATLGALQVAPARPVGLTSRFAKQ
jgi:hypothetical protein